MSRYDFRTTRLYIDAPFHAGASLELDASQASYLGNVLRLKAGDSVLMLLPAANRDGAAFPDAECVDLTRQPNRHITFGAGVHRCIGMHLARLELTVALEEVLAAFDRISVPEGCGPTFTGSQAAGIVSLPMEFVRAPGADV